MSQAQEIKQIYDELEEANDFSVQDLVYAPGGFLYTNYPEEWNDCMGKYVYHQTAPVSDSKKDSRTNFSGDIVYCKRLWDEFKT